MQRHEDWARASQCRSVLESVRYAMDRVYGRSKVEERIAREEALRRAQGGHTSVYAVAQGNGKDKSAKPAYVGKRVTVRKGARKVKAIKKGKVHGAYDPWQDGAVIGRGVDPSLAKYAAIK